MTTRVRTNSNSKLADFSGLSEANILIFFLNLYIFLNLAGRIVTISVLMPHAFHHHTADIYVGVFIKKKIVGLAGVHTCGGTRPQWFRWTA